MTANEYRPLRTRGLHPSVVAASSHGDRGVRVLTRGRESGTLRWWAERLGLGVGAIDLRMAQGKPLDEVLTPGKLSGGVKKVSGKPRASGKTLAEVFARGQRKKVRAEAEAPEAKAPEEARGTLVTVRPDGAMVDEGGEPVVLVDDGLAPVEVRRRASWLAALVSVLSSVGYDVLASGAAPAGEWVLTRAANGCRSVIEALGFRAAAVIHVPAGTLYVVASPP